MKFSKDLLLLLLEEIPMAPFIHRGGAKRGHFPNSADCEMLLHSWTSGWRCVIIKGAYWAFFRRGPLVVWRVGCCVTPWGALRCLSGRRRRNRKEAKGGPRSIIIIILMWRQLLNVLFTFLTDSTPPTFIYNNLLKQDLNVWPYQW